MRSSIRMGKIFGIEFHIHVTFFLLLLFVFVSVLNEQGLRAAFSATLFICAIFVCVLIHEIGHSLIARRFGKETKSITLLPIGGMAAMEEIPQRPLQEIAMAIIGPMINLAIAGVLYTIVGRWTGVSIPGLYPASVRSFVGGLIGVNISLAIFNMLPAFPMDGGRVFRGLLALKMDYVRATSVAVSVGQALAVVLVFIGVFFNLWLALIGLFLYIGAGSEKQQVIVRSMLHKVPVAEVMTTDFRSLHPDEPIGHALEHFYHGCQEDFPVIGDNGIEGILTRDRILASIHEKGLNVHVSEIMDRTFTSVAPETPLDDVYKQLHATKRTAVAVVEDNTVKGIVCLDSLSRYFMVKAAMK